MMGFTFGQPLWLWALGLLPLCAGLYLWNSKRRREILGRVVSPRLRELLVANVSHTKRRLRFGLFLLALGLLVVALAQPRRGFIIEETTMKGRDVIIAIDTSRSMLANDLPPDRLTRAKLAAQDLIGQLGGDRVGLVAFAGSSFLQAPLTADYSAVTNALNELDTDIIPRGGTNLAGAIATAVEAFGKGESSSRALIIFTDGEELDRNALAEAGKLEGQVRIFTVGVGSEAGSVIPVPGAQGGTDFVRDAQGQVVKSKLDEGLLSRLAEASGGFYLRLKNGPADMARIIGEGLSGLTEGSQDERTSRRAIERYQWPLAAGILLLAGAMFITDRKRLRRAAAALALLTAHPALALDAVKQYEAGRYEESYRDFDRHMKLLPDSAGLEYGKGAAAYQLGKYDEALTSFSQALTTEDPALRAKVEYNIGNTLFQRGNKQEKSDEKIKEWTESLAHYDETLKLEPQNEDAQYNRDLVAKLIEQEKQKQEEEKKQDEQKKEDEKKDEPQKDQPKDEQKKDQKDSGEQDQKDDQKKDGDQGEEKEDGESGQDEKKKDPQQGGGGEEQPEQKEPGKGDEKPDDSAGEGEEKSKEPQPQQGEQEPGKDESGKGQPQPGQSPGPVPEQPERDREGDLQAQPGEQGEKPEPSQAAIAAAAAEAAEAEGKMSEGQAAALLRSLQGDEVSVPLNQPPPSGPVTKDW